MAFALVHEGPGTARIGPNAIVRVAEALEAIAMPLLGALPRHDSLHLPSRHLGLLPAHELADLEQRQGAWADLAERHLELEQLWPLLQAPEPRTAARSMPASNARRRVAGEARTRPLGGTTVPAAAVVRAGVGAAAGDAATAGAADTAAESSSKTASSAPTAMTSPGLPPSATTRPPTGEGTSTTAFSVDISTSGASSRMTSPGATFQAITSADTVPSPRSGKRITCRVMWPPP